MKYIVDSYAWIEYLGGSPAGQKVREIIGADNEIYSLNLSVAEVVSRIKRLNENADLAYEAIISNSKIIDIDVELAKEAGLLHAETRKKIKDFGLVDVLILVSARKLKAKILTGDPHFKGFKEAVFIK